MKIIFTILTLSFFVACKCPSYVTQVNKEIRAANRLHKEVKTLLNKLERHGYSDVGNDTIKLDIPNEPWYFEAICKLKVDDQIIVGDDIQLTISDDYDSKHQVVPDTIKVRIMLDDGGMFPITRNGWHFYEVPEEAPGISSLVRVSVFLEMNKKKIISNAFIWQVEGKYIFRPYEWR